VSCREIEVPRIKEKTRQGMSNRKTALKS